MRDIKEEAVEILEEVWIEGDEDEDENKKGMKSEDVGGIASNLMIDGFEEDSHKDGTGLQNTIDFQQEEIERLNDEINGLTVELGVKKNKFR